MYDLKYRNKSNRENSDKGNNTKNILTKIL